MTRTISIALITLCVATAATAQQPPVLPRTHAPQPTSAAIDVSDVMTRTYIIADDSMQGRESGKLGGHKVEEYLAAEFKRMGLQPGGENGSYFQAIPLVSRKVDPSSALHVGGRTLVVGTDFVPVPRIGAQSFLGGQSFGGEFTGSNVPTIFGGRVGDKNLVDPALVQGKVVVFAAARDAGGRLQQAFWQRDPLTPYLKGARAVVIAALDAGVPAYARAARDVYDDVSRPWPDKFTVMMMSTLAAGSIFNTPIDSVAIGTAGAALDGHAGFVDAPTDFPARNVIGIIPGSDAKLKNEYVAVGAHHDHVGMSPRPFDHDSVRMFNSVVRPRGADDPPRAATPEQALRVRAMIDSVHALRPVRPDSIFNGADDDGSGTVLSLEIAESFAMSKTKPKRSLIFVLHTAEEKGLYGAQFFGDHTTVPRDSIVAQINMDQMGRGGPDDHLPAGPNAIALMGSRRLSTQLGDLVEKVNGGLKSPYVLDYAFDQPGDPLNGYCRSDHYMYARHGIPVVFFSAAAWHRDYHMVTDEAQYIDYPRMTAIGSFIRDVVGAVANMDQRPVVDKPKPGPNDTCRQ